MQVGMLLRIHSLLTIFVSSNILKNRYDDTTEPGSVILNPGDKLCSVESTVKLTDEIGIKELDSLYYDIFDYNTKKWSKKSSKMKKKYCHIRNFKPIITNIAVLICSNISPSINST